MVPTDLRRWRSQDMDAHTQVFSGMARTGYQQGKTLKYAVKVVDAKKDWLAVLRDNQTEDNREKGIASEPPRYIRGSMNINNHYRCQRDKPSQLRGAIEESATEQT